MRGRNCKGILWSVHYTVRIWQRLKGLGQLIPSHNITISSTIHSRERWNKLFVLLRTGGNYQRLICSTCFLSDTLGKTPPCKSILQPLSHTGDGSLNRCIMEHHILVQKHHSQRTEWQHQHTRNGSNLACPNVQNWNQLFLVAQSNLQFKTTQYHISEKYNCVCSSPTSRLPSKHVAEQYFEWRKESKSHTSREEKNWSQIKYWKK